MLFVNAGYENWPGIGNRDLSDRVLDRIRPHLSAVFESPEAFIAANDRQALSPAISEEG
jgi:hypothetical protein